MHSSQRTETRAPFEKHPPKQRTNPDKTLARQDEIDRIPIEGKVGQSKRRFDLDRVMTKMAITSQCFIAMIFLVINLEKGLRLLFLRLFYTYRR